MVHQYVRFAYRSVMVAVMLDTPVLPVVSRPSRAVKPSPARGESQPKSKPEPQQHASAKEQQHPPRASPALVASAASMVRMCAHSVTSSVTDAREQVIPAPLARIAQQPSAANVSDQPSPSQPNSRTASAELTTSQEPALPPQRSLHTISIR